MVCRGRRDGLQEGGWQSLCLSVTEKECVLVIGSIS